MKNPFESRSNSTSPIEQGRIEQKEFIEKLHARAKIFFKENSIPMDTATFPDYDPKMIERDKQRVARAEADATANNSPEEKEAKIWADILEAIFIDEAESSNHLGENVRTWPTSEYDNWFNHTDVVAEFEDAETSSYSAFGIDTTYSTDLRAKFQRIKDEINKGNLSEVKYFSSSKITGRLTQVPRFILGADIKTIQQLGELWINKQSKAEGEKTKNKKALEKHQIQFQLLRQLILQAKVFGQYARDNNQPGIADIYGRAEKQISKIYNEKDPAINDKKEFDTMTSLIKDKLNDLFVANKD